MPVRRLTMDDWPELWPLVQGFGTGLSVAEARAVYEELVGDRRRSALSTPLGEPDGVDIASEISRDREDER